LWPSPGPKRSCTKGRLRIQGTCSAEAGRPTRR
jgi:hypothetical protein